MSKQSRRPNRRNRNKFANDARARFAEHRESVPTDVESELALAWQDFAEDNGFFVYNNLRVPNISHFNRTQDMEFSFATVPSGNAEEKHLYDLFILGNSGDFIRTLTVRGEELTYRAVLVFFPTNGGLTLVVGWYVYRSGAKKPLTPLELDESYRSTDYMQVAP